MVDPPRRPRFRSALLGAIATAAVVALAIAAARGTRFQTFAGEAMATHWEVTLPARAGAEVAAEECFALFRRLDFLLSEWKESSPLSAVNRAAGVAPVEVPEELFGLLDLSTRLGADTEGAFDVSWAALWGLWDFRAAMPMVPPVAEVEARRRLVGYRRVALDRAARTVYLPEKGMLLGLGAIGKGYALERAAELLEARGYRDFMLVGGGQVVARGRRGGRPWSVGVRDPRGAADEVFARVELEDGSLSTSADNESFFVVAGRRYHHILDPRTGWPAASGVRSATVLHRDAALADALSTALLVLGRENGFEVVRRLGGEAVIVGEQGEVATTPGLAGRLEILRPPRREP
jgi:thiamine biosynthesis lipoprotein